MFCTPELDSSFTAPDDRPQALATHVDARALLIITALFWTYVALSNVLYAYGMQILVAQFTQAPVFSPGGQRLIQHALLFPVIFACYWGSLRMGWSTPGRSAAQVGLAVMFASLPYWVMDVAEFIYYTAVVPSSPDLGWAPPVLRAQVSLFVSYFTNSLIAYGFGLALVTAFAIYRRYHEAELRMSTMHRKWTAARLAALRMQLSPHALFNLLHAIRGQIKWDPDAAQEMLVQLADLLRRLLSAGQREFSLLADELKFVHLYLELQRQRFSDRLILVLPSPDGQAAVWLPSLILQPLVENAVLHGLVNHEAPVHIRVEVLIAGDRLVLRVINTIATQTPPARTGIGVGNVRERLWVQFGDRASLRSGPMNGTTWVAEIEMPVLRDLAVPARPNVTADA